MLRSAFVIGLVLLLLPRVTQAQEQANRLVAYTALDGTQHQLVASADDDGDGIENAMELDGYVYDVRSGDLLECTPEVDDPCFQTDPRRVSTDGDPYSDFMEVTGVNMPSSVEAPYTHPLVAARPIISVYMDDYTVTPLASITDSQGRSVSEAYTNETSNEDTIGGSITVGASATAKASLNPLELASVEATVSTEITGSYSHTWVSTQSSTNTSNIDWSTATSTETDPAATLTLNVQYFNRGSAPANDVRPTFNLLLGSKTIATFRATDDQIAQTLAPGAVYPANGGTIVLEGVTVTLDELRAIERGAPLALEVPQVEATIQRWDPQTQSFSNEINWAGFEAEIDPVSLTVEANLGDRAFQYQVYTGSPSNEDPPLSLRQVLGLILDVEDRGDATFIEGRRYPESWFASTNSRPILDAWEAANRPENLLDLPMERGGRMILLSPTPETSPTINVAGYSSDLRRVQVSAQPTGGFPITSATATLYLTQGTEDVELTRDGERPFFTTEEPVEQRIYGGYVTFRDARGRATVQDLDAPRVYAEATSCASLGSQLTFLPNPGASYVFPYGDDPESLYWANCTFFDGNTQLGVAQERAWSRATDTPSGNVYDVAVVNKRTAFAVGNSQGMWRTDDGGETWREPLFRINGSRDMRAITFVDGPPPDSVPVGYAVNNDGAVYKTSRSSFSWNIESNLRLDDVITDVAFADPLNGVMVGKSGAMYRTTDGAETWTPVTVTAPAPQGDSVRDYGDLTFSSVAMPTPDVISVTTFNAVITSTDGGQTWHLGLASDFSGETSRSSMSNVFFVDPSNGYAVGALGVIMGTTDGGRTWFSRHTRAPRGYLYEAVHFIDEDNGFVVSQGGLVLRTENGGRDWRQEQIEGDTIRINTISFSDGFGLIGNNQSASFRTEPAGSGAAPAGLETLINPTNLLVYHGYPSRINGATTLEEAIDVYKQYDYVILGEGYTDSDHPDWQNLVDLVNSDTLQKTTQFFGTIDIGVTTANLTQQEIDIQIFNSLATGSSNVGVFFDNAGKDFGVTRERLNTAIDDAHDLIRTVIVNATDPDDVFSTTVDPAYNPDGLGTTLEPDDFVFYDDYMIADGQYVDLGTWRTKADKLAGYREEYGFGIFSTTTGARTYDADAFAYVWHAALLDDHSATGWGEPDFAVTTEQATFRVRPTSAPGRAYLSPPVVVAGLAQRSTEGGVIEIDPASRTWRFGTATVGVSNEDTIANELPKQIQLVQNYPNPFNPTTTIAFELAQSQPVRLEVFDLLGRRVAVLVDEPRTAGQHTIRFDGSRLASGMYLYRLAAGNVVQTKTMVLVK